MAAEHLRERFDQAHTGIIAPEPRLTGPSDEGLRHEQWKHDLEEEWRGHLEDLQVCVCELLFKNQQFRMALMTVGEPEWKAWIRSTAGH